MIPKRGPDKKPRKAYARRPLVDRLLEKAKVNPQTGCWQWSASTLPDGYGTLGLGGHYGRPLLAHRASWEVHFGPIPDGLFVCHKCDNPGCVNPKHLFLGTPAENTADAVQKGRMKGPRSPSKGEQHMRAKLTEADVLEIRKSNESYSTLGAQLGVSKSAIHCVKRRKTWRAVLDAAHV